MGERTIVHVDMDAFYAAVEQMDHPELRGKPVIVGADPKKGNGRGVVSTCSYEARKFGVRSAMPVSRAYRLCPEGVFVPPRFSRYSGLSDVVMKCLTEFSPFVEAVSIDEAFLDCTGTEGLFGAPTELGARIKQTIKERTGLTASAGIAGCKSVAKIASDFAKPDGLTVVAPGKEKEFLAPLPVERLWGVGPKTASRLHQLGYHIVADVAAQNHEELERLLGKWGTHIFQLANAIDPRPVLKSWERKSISEETTFEHDTDDNEFLREVLSEIANNLAHKMLREDIKGRTLQFKIRLTGFETYTRSQTFKRPVGDMKSLRDFAWEQLEKFDRKDKTVRLIGVGVSELVSASNVGDPQLDLFGSPAEDAPVIQQEKVDRLIFEIGEKFQGKIARGSVAPKKSKGTEEPEAQTHRESRGQT